MQTERAGMLLCLVGPAGSGKTTLCERLLQEFGATATRSISVTTRTPRPGEVPGKSYHFTTIADFESRVERGEFFEWEENHGNKYGTLKNSVDDAIAAGLDLLLNIDIRGALNFKQQRPQHVVICFVTPPTGEELRRRIVQRGGSNEIDLKERLLSAEREFQQLLTIAQDETGVDYFVINQDLDVAYQTLRAILLAERSRLLRMSESLLKRLCKV